MNQIANILYTSLIMAFFTCSIPIVFNNFAHNMCFEGSGFQWFVWAILLGKIKRKERYD
jgi:hypothetical protein